jgi:cysteinyl-tRNA synthetase
MALKLTNTLTGQKEEFKPIKDGKIGIYACGVTVYDVCHLGHAMQAILFDVFSRYLRYRGYDVTYVRNFTDVDDKIIIRAQENGEAPLALSARMIEATQNDMAALQIAPADREPKVSEFIPEIIDFISTLIEKGAAYSTDAGNVYFRVKAKSDYGKLSNQNPLELRGSGRIQEHSEKEDPLDFALWKAESVDGAWWESPWGKGRPGWHIECSVMATSILGDRFDIHGGGRDLVFPHHENEIAQSEAKSGCGYANYWIHNGLMTINRQKMSKSAGNFLPIKEAVNRYGYELIRWNVYQVHYSTNIDFNDRKFGEGISRLYYYYRTLARVDELVQNTADYPENQVEEYKISEFRTRFHEAMDDDFNLPRAMVVMNEIFQGLNELMDRKGLKQKLKLHTLVEMRSLVSEFSDILQLVNQKPQAFFDEVHGRFFQYSQLTREELDGLLAKRLQARTEKNFEESDQIRDDLIQKGIQVMDTRDGQAWQLSDAGLDILIKSV